VRVRSGVEGFDDLIERGLPEGTNVVPQGPPGTRKETFALQFLTEGLRAGEAAIILTSSTSVERLLATFAKSGVDVRNAIDVNRLKVIDWYACQGESVSRVEERGHIFRCSVDLTNVGLALRHPVCRSGHPPPTPPNAGNRASWEEPPRGVSP